MSPQLELVEHPVRSARVPGLGAASRFPGALTVFPPLREFGGGLGTFSRCQARLPPPPAFRSSPRLSLANLTQFQSAVLPIPSPRPGTESDGGPWSGLYLAWVSTAKEKDRCSPLLSVRKPLSHHAAAGSSLLPPRAADQGQGGGAERRLGFEEDNL